MKFEDIFGEQEMSEIFEHLATLAVDKPGMLEVLANMEHVYTKIATALKGWSRPRLEEKQLEIKSLLDAIEKFYNGLRFMLEMACYKKLCPLVAELDDVFKAKSEEADATEPVPVTALGPLLDAIKSLQADYNSAWSLLHSQAGCWIEFRIDG